MQLYKVSNEDMGEKPSFCTKQSAAHEKAKVFPKHTWPAVRIELVQLEVTQQVMAEVLSGWGCKMEVLRTWKLSDRGGMHECQNGE
jgi:hypothetical protein